MKLEDRRIRRDSTKRDPNRYLLVAIPHSVALLPTWKTTEYVATEYIEATDTLTLTPVRTTREQSQSRPQEQGKKKATAKNV